jgi:hypothetical protein
VLPDYWASEGIPLLESHSIEVTEDGGVRPPDRGFGVEDALLAAVASHDRLGRGAGSLQARQPTDSAANTGVAHLGALFAILEPWSVLRPWDFAWALAVY